MLRWNLTGYGSAGTPPWVDEENIDEEKKKKKESEALAYLKAIKQENERLKKRVEELESELKKQKSEAPSWQDKELLSQSFLLIT